MWGRAFLIVVTAVAACSALPRDPGGTTERVRESRVVRVGFTRDAGSLPAARALVRRVEQATGARAALHPGETEPLLMALERGELELVLGIFDPKTPWSTRVALAPPIVARGGEADRVELRAAATNGENRWLMLVEAESRAIAPETPR